MSGTAREREKERAKRDGSGSVYPEEHAVSVQMRRVSKMRLVTKMRGAVSKMRGADRGVRGADRGKMVRRQNRPHPCIQKHKYAS